MTTPGLTPTRQAPAAAAATVSLDETATPTDIVQRLTRSTGLQDALVATLHEAARGRTQLEFREHLEDAGVDALHGFLADAAVNAVRAYPRVAQKRGAVLRLLRAVHGLGTGRSTLTDAHQLGDLLGLEDSSTPTIAVHVHAGFLDDVRRDQRTGVLAYLAALANGADIRLVGSHFIQHRLVAEHRETLPVSRSDITPPTGSTTEQASMAAAVDALDPDGRAVDILRDLAKSPSQTRTYGALTSTRQVSRSRIRQVASELVALDLAATFDTPDGKAVELRELGSRVLDALDAEYGQQAELGECVSATGNSVSDSRVNPPAHEGRPRGERLAGHHETTYLPRWQHAAATATAPGGGVGLTDHPVEPRKDRGGRGWSYDESRDRLVVSAEYDNPLQFWVCTALALADPRTWNHVLTPERLEGDVDIGGILLRQARCIGGVTSEAEDDPEELRGNIQEWASTLADLTRKLNHGEYEDRDRFRGEIVRSAHGLAGSLAHLLDVAGVDVVREVRIPRFRQFDAGDKADLASTVATGAAIQSRLGHFAAYRQLLEAREEKRDSALSPDIDASEPFGGLIGGFSIVGPGVDDLEDALVDALGTPAEVVEDAPEFQVNVPVVAEDQRRQYAQAAQQVLDGKGLSLTQDAVSLLATFAGTPYDAAEAVNALGVEEKAPGRRVEPRDIRYGLAQLPADRILPEAAPTVSAATHALLATDGSVSQSELAEAAGVSTRSLRTHWATLAALPWTDSEDSTLAVSLAPTATGAPLETLYGVAEVLDETVVDAATEVGAAFVWPPDVDVLQEAWWWGRSVLEYAGGDLAQDAEVEVSFGPRIDQVPLPDSGAGTPETRGGRS